MTLPPRRVSTWVMPIRLLNLLWLIPILIVPMLPDPSGTPHVLLFWMSTGDGPFKFYTECAYLGVDGSIDHLHGASCPYVRFFKTGRS